MHYTTLIARDVLARHLEDPKWIVFDCRFDLGDPAAGQRAYDQAHIPGARYAHLDADLSGPRTPNTGRHPLPDPHRLAAKLGAWGVDVRNADGLVVVSDLQTGFWAFKMEGFEGWNGNDWGMPNISSAQDWDKGPEGAATPRPVT